MGASKASNLLAFSFLSEIINWKFSESYINKRGNALSAPLLLESKSKFVY